VLNPNVKSTLTVRRLLRAAEHWRPIVVANAWSEEAPPAGIEPDLYVPFDPRVAQAERDAVPVVERYPDSPAVAEIRALARSLLNRAVEGACTSPLHAPFRTA
jgi:Flp pilus assembly CpaE family ATPase